MRKKKRKQEAQKEIEKNDWEEAQVEMTRLVGEVGSRRGDIYVLLVRNFRD